MLLSLFLNRDGVFRRFEAEALDLETRIAALQQPQQESDVAIVRISESDYRYVFQGRSPLDPKALSELVDAVAAAKPRVIGVDIDTSTYGFQNISLLNSNVPVVWGQSAVFSHRPERLKVFAALGGRHTHDSELGLIVYRLDPDRTLRCYQRFYLTDIGLKPSLPWLLADKFGMTGGVRRDRGADDERFIAFDVPRRRVWLDASKVLELAKANGWQRDSPLKNKVVLIGGDYAARDAIGAPYGDLDEHSTPIGWQLGVEVLAEIVDTEILRGGGQRTAVSWILFPLQLVGGMFLVFLFHYYRLSRALLVSFAALLPLTLLSSMVAFWTPSRWAYFVPCLLGILLQELSLGAWELRKSLLEGASNEIARKTQ